MALKSKRFQTAADLTAFVAANGITKTNIQEITSESASGGFTLFWWA